MQMNRKVEEINCILK